MHDRFRVELLEQAVDEAVVAQIADVQADVLVGELLPAPHPRM